VIGWLIVLQDITEEVRIAHDRELITETLVHDIRSPISAVLGAVDVIEEAKEPAIILRAVDVARRGGQRVLSLVESLLDIARLETGTAETILSPISLYSLVESVLEGLAPQGLEFELTLSNKVLPECPLVSADQEKISRVLINLVDNSIKFTPSGGIIAVTAQEAGENTLRVQVVDSGPGIPEAFREKVFERFSQAPGVQGRRRGSGLGLSFCKLAVEAHGGRIWIEHAPGGGNVVVFTLPIFREGK
jgi:NtrC-family two-component system sensor histidine kinase KinB